LVEKNIFLPKNLLISYWPEIEHVDSRVAEDLGSWRILITHKVGKVVVKQILPILACSVADIIE
jgi:hypothetical protein